MDEEAASVDVDTPPEYTFMGHDQGSTPYLPHGYGDEFPAWLTYRGGLDYSVIDLMRPLLDKGVN